MIVGISKETFENEFRVALTPDTVGLLSKDHFSFVMEKGAGEKAGFPDQEYVSKGVQIFSSRSEVFSKAQILVFVRMLGANPNEGKKDFGLFQKDQLLIGFCEPLLEPSFIQEAAQSQTQVFSIEMLPRITRAQSMDALSSMATVSGYKSVLLAAFTSPRMFPLLMTAAGTVSPARVLVLGAGVAGLQAIATAKRLGAVVSAYDVRPVVREQCESLGAKFVDLGLDTSQSQDSGGYAKSLGEEFYRLQRDRLAEVMAQQHVIISTALIPGQKAPILITKEMVQQMMPGTVVVDLAAERGGNCEWTQPGKTFVTQNQVTILGPTNLPSSIPFHASQMYARNMAAFLSHIVKKETLVEQNEDEIFRETCLTQMGKVIHPRIQKLISSERI